ncbi:MAG: aminotransferase class V-fold PLP-dependent enzyme [Gemmatimonadota bacterium]
MTSRSAGAPGRRWFLGTLARAAAGGALLGGGALAWPGTLEAFAREIRSGGGADDEDFWEVVRGGFLIPEGRIYLNNGTLGPQPRVVVDAVTEHTRRTAMTYPPGVEWEDLKGALGFLLDAEPAGFVLPRNTTEAMSFVANGLELSPGDEVVTTDHEHIGGLCPWELVTARRGATLRKAVLPVPAPSREALLDAIWERVGEGTRVVSVSHVTFTNGTTLPVDRLARRCRDAGIVFVVDGAHPPGMLDFSVGAIGADFYASSPHKWLLAPQGSGLLHLAPRWRTELWPTLASGGWDDTSLGAQRLNHMGTLDGSRLAGLLAALGFMEALGMERVEARVRHLRRTLRGYLEEIPGLGIVTPRDEALASGMLSFRIEGLDSLALQRHLAREADVRTRVISEYDFGWMRLSTHVYNLPPELERVASLLLDAARHGVPTG